MGTKASVRTNCESLNLLVLGKEERTDNRTSKVCAETTSEI